MRDSVLVLSRGTGGGDLQIRGHPDELSDRISVHLREDAMTMNLGRLLRDAEVEPYLFVQLAADEMRHDLAFPRRQLAVSIAEALHMLAVFSRFRIAKDRSGHRLQQDVPVTSFGQEIDCAALHGLDRVSDIGMPAYKNDGERVFTVDQKTLDVQTAHSG
jgi:hypothetical protein